MGNAFRTIATAFAVLQFWTAATSLWAAERGARYVLILQDPPLARTEDAFGRTLSASVSERASRIRAARQIVADAIRDRGGETGRRLTITGAAETLVNAIFVAGAGPEDELWLSRLPGVARVVEMQAYRRRMVRAPDLVRAQEAWRSLGGEANAGAGVKLAIIDTGIDQEHPAFLDPSLPMPAGYPRCRAGDCAFTNSKVIAARSYVDLLVLGDQPEFSRPDDLSPRDRVGHGTAMAMVAAGVRHNSPLGPMAGIAPRAHVGNYKIYGSPGVNDVAFTDVIIRALEDALADGMDIAVLSTTSPAIWGPDDRGATCDLANNRPCDPVADAVEAATRRGMLVVVAAGNDGDIGTEASPALNSVHSPGVTPSALAVGATTNAQRYFSTFRMTGGGVPQALQQARVQFGEGPAAEGPIEAPVRDIAAIDSDGRACSPLPNESLAGAIALAVEGGCRFSTKVGHAQRAGAVAVLVRRAGGDGLFPMTGLRETGIPSALIGATAGGALQTFLQSNPDRAGVLDPKLVPAPFEERFVAFFSSFGPAIGTHGLKPEVAAPGQSLYMAAQRFDPNGDMYSPDGYVARQGTSFAAPLAAGVASLFKQRFRDATPPQVKSAAVNTATADVEDVDETNRVIPASVLGVGAGQVNAADAARVNVTADPSTISFGVLRGVSLPLGRDLRINNHTTGNLNLRLEVRPRTSDRNARVVLSETSFTLAGRQSRLVSVRLEGTVPPPGIYEGEILVSGGATALRIPYLYLMGDGVAANAIPLTGFGFEGQVNGRRRLTFKLVDKYGVPVRGTAVRWSATLGGGSIRTALESTDALGIADASVNLGPRFGEQEFLAEAGNLKIYFPGRARLAPAIGTDSVVNAASNQAGRGVAPGSYIAIYGRGLSDAFKVARTPSLPLSLANVSVSFDVPERRLSLPGRLLFVSDGQINVQLPWELQGFNSVLMKVSIGDVSSDLYTVPLNDYSPALFEIADPSGRQIAAALDQEFRLVTTNNPVPRGGVVQLYANGLGPVENTPPTGEPSPAQPLSPCRVAPSVTVGGQPAEVLFSGLAPFNVGLYQMNLRLSPDTPAGVQPVVVTVNGIVAKTASLPVR